jgi:hypothetical protein
LLVRYSAKAGYGSLKELRDVKEAQAVVTGFFILIEIWGRDE